MNSGRKIKLRVYVFHNFVFPKFFQVKLLMEAHAGHKRCSLSLKTVL